MPITMAAEAKHAASVQCGTHINSCSILLLNPATARDIPLLAHYAFWHYLPSPQISHYP